MKTSKIVSCFVLLAGALASACATNPDGDPQFGKSVAQARARQTQNPRAGDAVQQIDGMGPGTSEDVMGNYHRNQDGQVQEQRQSRQRQDGILGSGGGSK